ncbi:COX15/CtaA family protein [Elongatibacter sediminis]|uniref:COX15/CtaA family protein n=1 Tax=Elongatibacter sediminis TaxID=3119006 RepID=A0AAW9RDM9_9GAMM
MNSTLHRLAVAATLVAFVVIVLGAFVRLSDAGLGCPDWPGCYGKLTWPKETHEIASANEAFPERPVEHHKAWKEMVHRYLAGILVLLVLAINFVAWRGVSDRPRFRILAAAILALILFQAALGMWTVTLKLLPLVVMAHLLGGLTLFALLAWLAFRSGISVHYAPGLPLRRLRPWIAAGLVILIAQIALGGWTSANYAALACPDFPTCHGQYLPDTQFRDAFTLWREVGVDYEGGVLDLRSRVTIHFAHRVGAIVTFLVLLAVAVRLMRTPATQRGGGLLVFLLVTQITLGILNIVLQLPLPNAVAHNGVAALLLLHLIWLFNKASPGRP